MKMKLETISKEKLCKDLHKKLRMQEEEALLNQLTMMRSEKQPIEMLSERTIKRSWMKTSMKSKVCQRNFTKNITINHPKKSIIISIIRNLMNPLTSQLLLLLAVTWLRKQQTWRRRSSKWTILIKIKRTTFTSRKARLRKLLPLN